MKNSDLTRVYGKDNMKNENGFARLNENGELDAPVSSTNIVPPATVPEGKIMASDGDGGTKWVDAEQGGGTEVIANPENVPADAAPLAAITINGVVYKIPNANLTLLAGNVEEVLEV